MENKNTETNVRLVLAQIGVIFVLPVLLLYFGLVPESWRIVVLFISSLFIYGIIKYERWEQKDFGYRIDNFRHALLPYTAFTLVGVTLIIWFADQNGMTPVEGWWTNPHFLYLFLIVSFLQEFAFRGFLIPLLKKVFKDRLGIVLINALLFTLIHILYPVPTIMLPLAFIGGLGFATLYMIYPNLILISLAHAVLNFVAVLFGFFVIIS